MPRWLSYTFGTFIALLLVGGPLAYSRVQQAHIRQFHVVKEGVFYRSGQMSLFGLKQVLHDYGFKTIVSLRDGQKPGDPPPDLDEEKYCLAQEIRFCRISPRTWWSPDGDIPADEGIRQFRAVMDDPRNYPVLIHCFGGIHRTGAFCAIYRMEYEHWTNEQAIAELQACGYSNLPDEWDLLRYLEHYRPSWQPGAVEHSDRKLPVQRGKHKGKKGRNNQILPEK